VASLGRGLETLGRYEEAIAAFNETIERGPSAGLTIADAHAWLAFIHAAQGREEYARASMSKALKALPNLSATQYRRRIYLKDPDALEKRIAEW